ncbi:MAG: 16S rRNA (adenine(1518)-N(6)/adenine(1519)-N(6))-dimethyltransferase RsmA, partial [bacterium]|nr:16S rRNA (adenine(1518)-N(6)/adenine(1519)-N(6))-dimethyltransferase RsmA [bacterium]
MAPFTAKRHLGQNFLKDHKVLERIAEVLDISPQDTVVEIGPGHGELTRKVLKCSPRKLIAIEKDSDLIRLFLEDLVNEYPNLEIVEGDALDELPKIDFPYKLVGNIPYYITGYLLRILQQIKQKPEAAVFTLQKEVANRLCATAPDMNLLSASISFWARPELIRYISKKSFKPAPKVDSAIVRIVPISPQPSAEEAEPYYKFVKVLFKQSRKTILNNLKPLGATADTLKEAG